MPVLQCSQCAFATSCTQFKAGYECAYLPYLNSHKIESEQDLMESMKNLCEASLSRTHRQAMMETLTGGMPTLETAEALNMTFMQLKELHQTMVDSNAEISLETEDDTIIGKLFGGLGNLIEDTAKSHAVPMQVAPVLHGTEESALLAETKSQADVNLDLIREFSRSEVEHASGHKLSNRNTRAQQGVISVSEISV